MTESAEGSRIIQAGVAALDAGGGAGHPDRVSSTEIPARAGDDAATGSYPGPVCSRNLPPGDEMTTRHSVVPTCPEAPFWGTLSPAEDVLLWDMRRLGVPFPLIAAEIETRREKAARGRRGGLKRWARHYREQIRQERAR